MDEKANGEQGLVGGQGLEDLEQRFKRWRESRRRGEHIPRELWEAAAEMAREHGVPRIANRLRLSAVFLKRRIEGTAGQARAGGIADAEFVELVAAPTATATTTVVRECVIEFENARGAKMRVELNGQGLAGLTHLCSGFWSAI